MKYTDISIIAAPFGYGPPGKSLAIAAALKEQGYTVKILGDSNALRIIKETGNLGYTYDYRDTLCSKELNTDLIVSYLDISTSIEKNGVPLVLADSLFWLRNRWERPLRYNADMVLAQRFFMKPDEKTILQAREFHFVDAILPHGFTGRLPKGKNRIVYYPGGLRSPYLGMEYGLLYYWFGLKLLVTALAELSMTNSKLLVLLPPQIAIGQNTRWLDEHGIEWRSSVADTSEIIMSASHSLIAPGIETTLESLASAVNPCFLPAFNGSHIPQLIAYRNAGVGYELSETFNDGLIQFEKYTDNLSALSMQIEKYTSKNLSPKVFEESLKTLCSYLENPQTVSNRYPLGKDGANQMVEFISGLMNKK